MLLGYEDNSTAGTEVPGDPISKSRPRLRVEPWLDALIDELGYDARSDYVETFWLPILGPSTTWLLRHLAARLDTSPEGLEIDVEETARCLGLGERLGPNAPFARTLKRCIDFDMAEWREPLGLAVRLRLPPLAGRHLRRLPESLQAKHEASRAFGAGTIQTAPVSPVGFVLSEHAQELSRDCPRARRHL